MRLHLTVTSCYTLLRKKKKQTRQAHHKLLLFPTWLSFVWFVYIFLAASPRLITWFTFSPSSFLEFFSRCHPQCCMLPPSKYFNSFCVLCVSQFSFRRSLSPLASTIKYVLCSYFCYSLISQSVCHIFPFSGVFPQHYMFCRFFLPANITLPIWMFPN